MPIWIYPARDRSGALCRISIRAHTAAEAAQAWAERYAETFTQTGEPYTNAGPALLLG